MGKTKLAKPWILFAWYILTQMFLFKSCQSEPNKFWINSKASFHHFNCLEKAKMVLK